MPGYIQPEERAADAKRAKSVKVTLPKLSIEKSDEP